MNEQVVLVCVALARPRKSCVRARRRDYHIFLAWRRPLQILRAALANLHCVFRSKIRSLLIMSSGMRLAVVSFA